MEGFEEQVSGIRCHVSGEQWRCQWSDGGIRCQGLELPPFENHLRIESRSFAHLQHIVAEAVAAHQRWEEVRHSPESGWLDECGRLQGGSA